MLESGIGMEYMANCQKNRRWLWRELLRAVALSVARVSLVLIVVLVMAGFSLVFVDQGHIAHAAQVHCLPQVSRTARAVSLPATSSAALGLATNSVQPSLSIGTSLPSYGASGGGGGLTLVFNNLTISLVIKKLELELAL